MKLTIKHIESLKPKEKPYKVFDGLGLYLSVLPGGGKSWRIKYTFSGKQKNMVLGLYPTVSLACAREKLMATKKMLMQGIDPAVNKQEKKQADLEKANDTFKKIALEWHEMKKSSWSQAYGKDIWQYLNKEIFPSIGNKPISQIKTFEMFRLFKKMEKRGVLDKLKKTRQACNQIFVYAIILQKTQHNPVADLAGVLKAPEKKPFAHLQECELKDFYSALNKYEKNKISKIATKILMLTGVRTVELRLATWKEIDLEKSLWKIPAERMKMKREHIIPLSKQVSEMFKILKYFAGDCELVLPGRSYKSTPVGESFINKVIEDIGYKGRLTGHGFRHTLSTILHEHNFNSMWIEMQLAHADKNSLRAIYNHALYLEPRKEMLQWYADYIENL